jgi:sterol 3beta-glucosyltransferase
VNEWRQETLDLPPLSLLGPEYRRDRVIPMLYAYSARISPRPHDWPAWRHVTGYWFLETPADWAPPPELLDFLEDGPPPVWVGFGSMVASDAQRQTDLVLAALRRAGKRAILQTGWGGLGQGAVGSDIYVVRAVEHHWLFPRAAGVVHHGGGGTTAAGLRAGAPSVVTPFFADQFYWADRVRKLGAGPPPISHHQLTVENLAAALRTATEDEGIRARAQRVGEALRAEDGVARAVEIFESYVREWYGLRPEHASLA